MNNFDQPQETAFLDTNALHYVDLTIRSAGKDATALMGTDSGKSFSGLLKKMKKHKNGNMRTAIKKGASVIAFCHEEDLQIAYSPISEVELQVGRARGRALLILAEEHVPERMWSTISDAEISNRMAGAPLAECRRGVDNLCRRLEGDFGAVAPMGRGLEPVVWDLVKILSGLVYLTTADCIIYANALLAEVKYVVTFDEHLRKTINRVNTNPKYRSIQDEIREFMKQNLRPDFRFPMAPKNRKLFEYLTRERPTGQEHVQG